MNADAWVQRLELAPHPEGGHYRETYRSPMSVPSPVHGRERSTITDIYFLLKRGEVSRFHKVEHDEIWHFYAGSPLRLLTIEEGKVIETIIGSDTGEFKFVVSAGCWQAAESTGDFSLVGCTVGPGFDFDDFQFLADSSTSSSVPQSFSRFV